MAFGVPAGTRMPYILSMRVKGPRRDPGSPEFVLYSRGELLILSRATGVESGMVATVLRTLCGIAVLVRVVVLTTLRTCRTVFVSDAAFLARPRLSAYSLPSMGPICAGSKSR